MPDSKTKILIVEHERSDIDMIQRVLKKSNLNFVSEVVETENAFESALRNFMPNIILSDYSLPSFSGPAAFEIKEKIAPNTPFVFVSGTIGEENSIELIKNGVTDYALKDKLFTLPVKVIRALKESKEKQLKFKREQDLIQSERRLARAQQIAHMGSWELNFATGIANWSEEACRIYGLTPSENMQTMETWLSFSHPDDADFVLKEVMKSHHAMVGASFHRRIVRSDGSIRHIYSESKFEFDPNGRPIILFGIEHDVTEIKTAAKALRWSEANLSAIVDNADTGYILLDDNFKILTFNETAQRLALTFIHRNLHEGKSLVALMPENRRAQMLLNIQSVMAGQNVEYEISTAKADGSVHWAHVRMYGINEDDGKINGLCIAVSDISERKNAQVQILALNESLEKKVLERTVELAETNKELEAFNYTVSHDLQAPLRIVNGFAKILMEDYGYKLDDTGKEHLLLIGDMAKRMSQLIKELLLFARLGKTPLAKRNVNMNDLVKVIVQEVKISYPNPLIEFKLHELPPAMCDAGLIKQVWANIIFNAVKYSGKKENPVIEVGVREIYGEQTYFVKDNGAGFDMSHADKLFMVFRRLHSDSEFEGTGVGLALVHRILTRHDGKIWAEGVVGEGATFYFSLPE